MAHVVSRHVHILHVWLGGVVHRGIDLVEEVQLPEPFEVFLLGRDRERVDLLLRHGGTQGGCARFVQDRAFGNHRLGQIDAALQSTSRCKFMALRGTTLLETEL